MTETITPTVDMVDLILIANNITYSTRYLGETDRDDWVCDAWKMKFETKTVVEFFMFYTGLGLRDKGNPRAADVLHCLLLDASVREQSFNDWCSDFGQNNDSIKALNVYKECCGINDKLQRLLPLNTRKSLEVVLQDY